MIYEKYIKNFCFQVLVLTSITKKINNNLIKYTRILYGR